MLWLLFVIFSSALVGYFIFCLPTFWFLRVLRINQHIRKEGPSTHIKKEGTPTMGGIAIVLTIIVFTLVLLNVDIEVKYLGLLILFAGYAFIGFLDDYIKIKGKTNQGLQGRQKILLQILFSAVFAFFLIISSHNETVSGILAVLHFDMPFLYVPLVVLMCISASNAVNLTDGLDGLAPGCLIIIFLAFGILANKIGFDNEAIIAMTAAGATLAFLPFNFPKAQVFMGDVGSMGLGGLLAGIAILIHKELLLMLIGGVLVIETLSVILQVASYKLFKTRILKMSPLHHHFELLGFSEQAIVISFWLAAAIFASLGTWLG